MFDDFYRNRRVLVTGHTGFKGGWLSLWLRQLGASVHGLALPATASPTLFETLGPDVFESQSIGDIRDLDWVMGRLATTQPEVVFHLAAQPLVRRSYDDPYETFRTNTLGSVNVLEAIRRLGLSCATVVVTTDKCYENREWCYGYRENDPLGGHDPYAMSKAAAELAVDSYRRCFFGTGSGLGPVASARAGNVIGGGDYAPERIVPDAVRALVADAPVVIRHPEAIRPWQHVLESLSGYVWLARLLSTPNGHDYAEAFNFGPGVDAEVSVLELVRAILESWPGEFELGSEAEAPHEAGRLNLSIDKATSVLGWRPTWGFDDAIRSTIAWYRHRHLEAAPDMEAFSLTQISEFSRAAGAAGVCWAKL